MSEIKEDFKNLDTQEVRYSYDEKNGVKKNFSGQREIEDIV